jgi:hypothetical protein
MKSEALDPWSLATEGTQESATAQQYADIIDLPHYEPKHHPRMSMWNRAAQFAPFAALTGYDAAIQEIGQHS